MFNGQIERFVQVSFRLWNIRIDLVHQFHNGVRSNLRLFTLQRTQGRPLHKRYIVPLPSHLGEQLSHLHLHQLCHFLVGCINLIDKHHNMRHTNLLGKQQVFSRLRHSTVRSSYNQNCSVHLRCSRDHVLNIISVAGTVGV
uniref:Uncharacterized protein n=1 Tax=Cacopsylla melanoneura TaxID=428564 RepID=A0A8D8RF11_9HEMI